MLKKSRPGGNTVVSSWPAFCVARYKLAVAFLLVAVSALIALATLVALVLRPAKLSRAVQFPRVRLGAVGRLAGFLRAFVGLLVRASVGFSGLLLLVLLLLVLM